MRVFGEPATAPRMLLLNDVRFDPDWIFRLELFLFIMPGDQVRMDGDRLTLRRATGQVEHPAGDVESWCWHWRLV